MSHGWRWQAHPLAPALAAAFAAVAYLLLGVLLGHRSWPALGWGVGAAAVAGLLLAGLLPSRRRAMTQALVATAVVFLALRLAHPWLAWLDTLTMPASLRFWLMSGPGGGVLGFLPSALLVLAAGTWLFGLSLREQWGGRFILGSKALRFGLAVGVSLAALTLGLALALQPGALAWQPNWAGHAVNLASNLYEEILVRGMLLQVVRRHANGRIAAVWTGIVFGLMHGLDEKAVFVALTSWAMAWAVLATRSLWAGWVAHEASDVLIDSLLH